MPSKVNSIFFSIIFITILVAAASNDGINREIQNCADYTEECNPELSNPCCDTNTTCKLINNIFKTNRLGFFCFKSIELGAACEYDMDCTEDNFGQCNKVCGCRKDNPTCQPTLFAYCKNDNHCKVENSICRQGFCSCNSETQQTINGTMCLPM